MVGRLLVVNEDQHLNAVVCLSTWDWRIVMNMKIVGFILLGVGVAVWHPRPEVYAGQSVPAQKVEQVQPSPDDPAWVAWRTDFEATLETDQKYVAARDAAENHVGDDADEYSRLESIRDARYRELARIVHTKYFGEWQGTDEAFDELIAAVMKANLGACAKAAVEVCGAGRVCWIIYDGTTGSCRVACMDGKGECPKPE